MNFLGIHHADCYDDARLLAILSPHIGRIVPFKFDKPTDALIQSSHWSNADELLEFCNHLASTMPDGKFPAEDWLRKRGRWEERDGETYNTLSVYIKLWLGGIRNLRRLMGQDYESTKQWDRKSAIAAFQQFWKTHGLTPHQARHKYRNRSDQKVSEAVAKEAVRIASAVEKYAGGAPAVIKALGINPDPQHKWSNDAVLSAFKQTIEKHGLSPSQVRYDHVVGRMTLSTEESQMLSQLIDAITRFPGGLSAIYGQLGIIRPSRPRRKKSS